LTVINEKSLSNSFVPQSNEFKETFRELENKATDVVGRRILKRKTQKQR
jgi:hypothetical protein